MNKIASVILVSGLIIGMGIIFLDGSGDDTRPVSDQAGSNVEIKNDIQYVTIVARGGYSPRISTAKAGIPTKLIIKTNGTYDCSSSLVIRSIGYKKILSQSGQEIIDLGTPVAGTPLLGTCTMGMYNFSINFD